MAGIYGYARVSARDQNEVRQLDALTDFGISKGNIFVDKQSGKDFDRPQYRRLLRKLRPGDLLVILSIDRLGRNYEEILEQWRRITRQKKADIFVMDFPLLDTRSRSGDLTGKFVSDLVLQILAYVAQKERENIRQRQAEGIAAAKLRGKHLGRERVALPEDALRESAGKWSRGELTAEAAAGELGVSTMTFYRRCRELGIKKVQNSRN